VGPRTAHRGAGIPFRFHTAGDRDALKARARGVLDYSDRARPFRVVQESIINISKHADAKNVSVSAAFDDSGSSLRSRTTAGIRRPEGVRARPGDSYMGLGLMGMEERVGLLDGNYDPVGAGEGRGSRCSSPFRPERTRWISSNGGGAWRRSGSS
jgi:signal transduction histidine kinase